MHSRDAAAAQDRDVHIHVAEQEFVLGSCFVFQRLCALSGRQGGGVHAAVRVVCGCEYILLEFIGSTVVACPFVLGAHVPTLTSNVLASVFDRYIHAGGSATHTGSIYHARRRTWSLLGRDDDDDEPRAAEHLRMPSRQYACL